MFITEQDLIVGKATLGHHFRFSRVKCSFKTVLKMNTNTLVSSYRWDDVEKQSFSV